MGKRKKRAPPKEPESNPPLNMRDDIDDMRALMAGCMSIHNEAPIVGVFTVVTCDGHYDFMINETLANEMIQALRQFLAGESPSMLHEEDPTS